MNLVYQGVSFYLAPSSGEIKDIMVLCSLKTKMKAGIYGATTTQWIRLRLPSYHPRVESQAHHLPIFI